MKRIIMFAAIFIAFINAVCAQDSLPASLPIGSKTQLRAYAIEQVAGGSTSVYGDSIMWSSSSTAYAYYHPQTSVSVDGAMSALQSAKFNFLVTDKSKPLSVWSDLHNKNWSALFYGSSMATVSAGSVNNLVSSGVDLSLADYVPIYTGTSVQQAYIKNQNWEVLPICNGYVYFPKAYAGSANTLILRVQGSEGQLSDVGYSLKTGDALPTYSVSGTVNVWLGDYQSFYDQGYLANQTLCVGLWGYLGDSHEAPIASVKITSKRLVKFSCWIRDSATAVVVQYPVRGWLYKKGDIDELEVVLTPNQWTSGVMLDPGDYTFYPETSLYDSPATNTTVVVGDKG